MKRCLEKVPPRPPEGLLPPTKTISIKFMIPLRAVAPLIDAVSGTKKGVPNITDKFLVQSAVVEVKDLSTKTNPY